MTLRRPLIVFVTVSALTACGLGVVGTALQGGGDGGAGDAAGDRIVSADGDADAAIEDGDAALDADGAIQPTLRCPDSTLVTDCRACSGNVPIQCPSGETCVADCLACDAGSIACAVCSTPTDFIATCSPDLSPSPSCPLSQCGCVGDPSTCPLDTMVCLTIACVSCGDLGTNDQVCKAGSGMHKCHDGKAGPADRFKCK